MAVSIAQYVDLLFKKLQGVAKTANATVKGASNESIASPAFIRGDVVWTQADQIGNTAGAISGIANARTGTNAVECVGDTTVPPIGSVRPTWLTNVPYWISQEFGSTWLPKVYVGPSGAANIEATGTQIFAAGIGGTGEYYFDTQAGVLNFIGETIPTVLSAANVVYISGYVYSGLLGVTNLPDIEITGNIIVTGNVDANIFNGNTAYFGNVDVTGNVDAADFSATGNIIATGNITATGNIQGGNLISDGAVIGNVDISGNLTVANLTVQEYFVGNIVSISNTVSVTGNVSAGNLVSNALVSGANVQVSSLTANRVVYVGADDYLVDSANFTFDGANANIQGQLIVDNFTIDGTTIQSDANITIQSSSNGNIDITSNGTGAVNIDNISVADNTISSTAGNIVLDPAANIVLPDETANAVLYLTSDQEIQTSANLTFDGSNLVLIGSANIDNVRIDATDISSDANLGIITANNGNVTFTIDGSGIASFVSTTSLTIPVGNTAQRPGSPETGAIRFNTAITQVEVWDGAQWEVVGSDFVSITNQTINGDGSTDTFTLDESTTTAAVIVATNGVVQQPGVAYTVTGNSITFAEAPQISDTIDVRFTAAVTYVNSITNLSGNAEITVTDPGVANIATCDSLQLPSYTVASAANIATPVAGQIIYVTNGDSGNPCLAVYSGGAWKRVALGANIST